MPDTETNFILAHQARSIAEAMWGPDGTRQRSMSRPGAWWFTCSQHGGAIIDGRTLTAEERAALIPHCTPADADLYEHAGRIVGLMNPERRRPLRVPIGSTKTRIQIFTFEEDCAWCLLYLFTGIRDRDPARAAKSEASAQRTFDLYFGTTNALVAPEA